MGSFRYGEIARVDLEDRTLAHLQSVIGAKVRRGESFHLTWMEGRSTGGGRTTVWIHPRCSLVYRFDGRAAPSLNRAWLTDLMGAANSPAGLYVTPEPADAGRELDEPAAKGELKTRRVLAPSLGR
jgi:hypothetical protein